MCRLFGFLSNVPERVHASLVSEKNSLLAQSREHKDGWGIASYDGSPAPVVAHGLGAAHSDPEFERVSSLVSSHAVLAHVRLASVGGIHLNNAHPFVYERWAFAHNGTLRGWKDAQAAIEERIDPRFRALIKGETDSERCFYLFLTLLQQVGGLESPTVEEVARALAKTAQIASQLTDKPEHPKPTSTNFLVTDGRLMVGTRRNRTLFFSEHKKKSAGAAELPKDGARLEQIIIASEELSFEDHWHEIPEGSVIGVDRELRLRQWTIEQLS